MSLGRTYEHHAPFDGLRVFDLLSLAFVVDRIQKSSNSVKGIYSE